MIKTIKFKGRSPTDLLWKLFKHFKQTNSDLISISAIKQDGKFLATIVES